ncbi:MAG: FAD-dependent oxidoreductase [Solirubrobacterales bacterium]
MSDEPLVVGEGKEETPDRYGLGAFPRLDDSQLEHFRGLGRVRRVEPGDVLFAEGEQGGSFFIMQSGAVAIVEDYRGKNRLIAIHGERRFLGELGLLVGQRLYLTGVIRDAGEVIEVPLETLREIVDEDKALSDLILGAFMARRQILIGIGTGIRLIGSRFSPDSRRLREFLARNRMPYHWVDLEEDEDADALLDGLGVKPDETPVVILRAGEILRNPTEAELGGALGLGSRGATPELCDLVVVGAGPAGLATSLYAASEGLDVQGVESVATGGQAGTSARIENYLGFPAGISGSELTQRAGVQAIKFGARLAVPAAAVKLMSEPGRHQIELSNGETATGRSVVIATGARYRRLDVPRLEEFEMGGVYYAATEAEAHLCAGDPVVIVGGGNSAGQAAMFLSQKSPGCRLLIRGGDLGKSMSRYLVDQIERNKLINVCRNTEVAELGGERELESITVVDNGSGERTEVPAKALFVFIGASPHTEWLGGQLASDEHGFLLTGRDVQGEDLTEFDGDRPLFLETSRPGIFAVGDVHSGSIKRVASAVGEGSMSVRLVHQRLAAG